MTLSDSPADDPSLHILAAAERRALLVSREMLESADISDHLVSQGWAGMHRVATAQEAHDALSADPEIFKLLILGADHVAAAQLALSDACVDRGVAVLTINGRAVVQPGAGQVTISRPFTSDDLDDALRDLGLSE